MEGGLRRWASVRQAIRRQQCSRGCNSRRGVCVLEGARHRRSPALVGIRRADRRAHAPTPPPPQSVRQREGAHAPLRSRPVPPWLCEGCAPSPSPFSTAHGRHAALLSWRATQGASSSSLVTAPRPTCPNSPPVPSLPPPPSPLPQEPPAVAARAARERRAAAAARAERERLPDAVCLPLARASCACAGARAAHFCAVPVPRVAFRPQLRRR